MTSRRVRLSSGYNQRRIAVADLIRELMLAPRSVSELLELVEIGNESLRDWLRVLEDGGLVWPIEHRHGKTRWRVYHWCPVPFEEPPTVDEPAAQRAENLSTNRISVKFEDPHVNP